MATLVTDSTSLIALAAAAALMGADELRGALNRRYAVARIRTQVSSRTPRRPVERFTFKRIKDVANRPSSPAAERDREPPETCAATPHSSDGLRTTKLHRGAYDATSRLQPQAADHCRVLSRSETSAARASRMLRFSTASITSPMKASVSSDSASAWGIPRAIR